MGNLRDNYTDEEWDEIYRKICEDKKNGKPDSHIIHLSSYGKTNEELKEIRKAIEPFFDDYQLRELDDWITWNDQVIGESLDSYSVIGRWIEDGKEEWDIIHNGPISYEEALKISYEANKKWRETAPPEYIDLPHHEIPIKYTTLQKMLKEYGRI